MVRGTPTLGVITVVLLGSLGCASEMVGDSAPEGPVARSLEMEPADEATLGGAAPDPAAASPPRAKEEGKVTSRAEHLVSEPDLTDLAEAPPPPPRGEPPAEGDAGEADGARTRSWFPESLLWRPLVETDGDGVATVPVTVPDQLTTWRVLALAHDRRGQQAGAEHRFVGTLPVYVEPLVPGWLYAGDRVVVPVQAVNTTGRRLEAELTATATGAASGAAGGALSIGPGGSGVRSLSMEVDGAGEALVSVRLQAGDTGDAAERSIVVHPRGKPVSRTRGGGLTGERRLSLAGPAGADPRTERVEVVVFPGPLAVVQAELERLSGGPTDGAYAFAVAGHAEALASAVGVELDEDALRKLRILAWQRVVRSTRSPSAGQAADLLLGMGEVSGHELAEQRVRILQRALQDGQRADGSFSRVGTSTVQRVIVETALAGRVLPAASTGPRLRAQGALERLLPEVKDPYTAAVVLASGLLPADETTELRALVEEAVVERDGQHTLPVPANVVNAWGVRPSSSEMLAVGALALDGEAQGDLVAALMQRWSSVYGFGAGRADPLALEAIVSALPTHDGEVTVSLSLDGRPAAQGTLDPSQPGVPAALTASANGAEQLTLTASPEVPGPTFVATRRSWVPWGSEQGLRGIDVEVDLGSPSVGQERPVTLSVSAPKGVSVTLEQGLPAGASVDEDALRQSKAVTSYEVRQDRVILTTRALGAGEVLEVPLQVTPAFEGRFSTVPLKVTAEGREALVQPATWTVGGAPQG